MEHLLLTSPVFSFQVWISRAHFDKLGKINCGSQGDWRAQGFELGKHLCIKGTKSARGQHVYEKGRKLEEGAQALARSIAFSRKISQYFF